MVSLHLNTSAWSIPHFSGKIGHGVQCSLPQFFDRQSIMLFPMSFSFSGPVQVHAGAKSVLGHQYVLKRLEAPWWIAPAPKEARVPRLLDVNMFNDHVSYVSSFLHPFFRDKLNVCGLFTISTRKEFKKLLVGWLGVRRHGIL